MACRCSVQRGSENSVATALKMPLLNNTSAAFIGAAVTLILAILFFIFLAIMIKLCLKYLHQRRMIQARRAEAQARRQHARQQPPEAPVAPTFDWHHSIRIAGEPPPDYEEAKSLPNVSANEEDVVSIGKTKEIDIKDVDSVDADGKSEKGAEEDSTEAKEKATSGEGQPAPAPANSASNQNGLVLAETIVAPQEAGMYYLWRDNNTQ